MHTNPTSLNAEPGSWNTHLQIFFFSPFTFVSFYFLFKINTECSDLPLKISNIWNPLTITSAVTHTIVNILGDFLEKQIFWPVKCRLQSSKLFYTWGIYYICKVICWFSCLMSSCSCFIIYSLPSSLGICLTRWRFIKWSVQHPSRLEILEFAFTFNIKRKEFASLSLLPSTQITLLEWFHICHSCNHVSHTDELKGNFSHRKWKKPTEFLPKLDCWWFIYAFYIQSSNKTLPC